MSTSQRARGDRQRYHFGYVPTLNTAIWESRQYRQLSNHETYLELFRGMRLNSGPAPGIDGITYKDLSYREVAEIFRGVAEDIRTGRYVPLPTREVRIAKQSGTGHRTLRLRAITDRVVATGLARAMAPFWASKYMANLFGHSAGRGPLNLLASLERSILINRSWWLVQTDIADAFDRVNVDNLMADHRRYVTHNNLLRLTEAVIRDPAGQRGGVEQGKPYSSHGLNLRTLHLLDHPWTSGTLPPLRFADDMSAARSSEQEGQEVIRNLEELLRVDNMTLKAEKTRITDMRTQEAQIMGFTVRACRNQSGIQLGLGRDAPQNLGEKLSQAHQAEDPPEAARRAIEGWVTAVGPALLETGIDRLIQIVREAAQNNGFDHPLDRDRLTKLAHTGRDLWERSRIR